MPVLTCDILLEGIQRDVLFERLCSMQTHSNILKGADAAPKEISTDHFDINISGRFKTRTMGYHIEKRDDEHGGRRVRIKTTGKRSSGLLSYSLRTMKPSRNTLVTLTWDYSPGDALGKILDAVSLQEAYRNFLKSLLSSLVQEVKKDG